MESACRLFVITGIMASGKSTVAQALAERFDRSVHLRGDMFRRSVVSGRVDMSTDPSAEATRQLELRYELAAMCADRYVDAGFATIVQDVVLGPTLVDVIGMFRTRPLALVVLAPSPVVVAARERDRDKVGYHHFTPDELDADLRERTPRLGLWVDTTDMTVDATVQHILDHRDEALVGAGGSPSRSQPA
jgi:chloramphenicol 3-O-phosphotransferase